MIVPWQEGSVSFHAPVVSVPPRENLQPLILSPLRVNPGSQE